MAKKGAKKKFCSIFLAGVMAVSSLSGTWHMEAHGASNEGTVYAKHSYDSSYDAQNAYNGNDLGCTYTPEKTTFKVWSPEAAAVSLCRYTQGDGGSCFSEKAMTKGDKGVWSITIQGDIANTYYTYKVTVDGVTKEAVDIYAKATGVNGDRAMVVDLKSTNPENWDTNYKREKTLLSDIIVWEVHVRDFSIDPSSGVSQENRGKYKAFTEKTTVNGQGQTPSCVEYLKELGVTHVQILPMYDYASVDETKVTTTLGTNYNWGYDPENYNVPEGSYSSNPYDGNVRIREMKEMIQALHDAGIKVIMDVVYNHTYDTAESNFNKIMPDYYYKINSDKSYNNQSGCGNATRSESEMYRKFMVDSLTYWAEEYNLDGFRFDLMGIHDVTTMNLIRNTLDEKFGEDTIVLYGEGWTGDGTYDSNSAHKANEAKLDSGIGYFNDQIRDAIKGEHKFDGTIGLVQTNYFSGSYLEVGEKWPNNVFGGIMGSVGYTDGQYGMWRPFWSKSSNCSLSYASAHDNLTLWDKLTENVSGQYNTTDERLIQMNKMTGGVILTSKGGVFMQAGEEFARTKSGDENSYASSDATNRIDWTRVNTYSSIQKYYEGLIRIRKAFSGFRSITTRSGDNWNPNNNNLEWISRDVNGLIAFYETNQVAGEWNKIAVLINNALSEKTVSLSESNWVIIANGTTAGLEKIYETGSNVTVPEKSVVIAVPKDTFDACNITENKVPVITAKSSYEISAGETLSFDVKVSDPDGDPVTVTCSDLPSRATFQTTTGAFQWTEPVAGTYTLLITASDGKDKVTHSITIQVVEKTAALKNMVAEIENQGYQSAGFTEAVWTPLDTALNVAKQYINNGETEDAKLEAALEQLRKSYEAVAKEDAARKNLEDTLSNAEKKLESAKKDSDNYDEAAVEDLQTVITEASTFLNTTHEATEYDSVTEDLEYAMKACVCLKSNPTIRVKAEGWNSPAVYIWTGSGESATPLAGSWPGTKLSAKDDDGWYVYELPETTTGYSLIVNDGAANTATQTSDITDILHSVDVTVTSFTGKTCSYVKEMKDEQVIGTEVDKTRLASMIDTAAKVLAENSTSSNAKTLETAYNAAKNLYESETATQVEVNQSVRGLKQSVKAVEEGKELLPPDAPVDMTVSDTVEKVSDIPLNSGWQWSDEDKDTAIKQGSTVEVTAVYQGEDKANYETLSVTISITVSITGVSCKHEDTSQYEVKNQVEATCTTDGYTGDTYCTQCQTKISVGETTKASGHQWNQEATIVKEPTCTEAGVKSILCSVCNEEKSESREDVGALGHTGGSADCSTQAVCDRCNEKYGVYDSSKHNHTEIQNKQEATCENDGYTGDLVCSDCDTVLTKGETIKSTDHTWDGGKITKDATETEEGVKTYTCTVCSSTKTEPIPLKQPTDPENPGEQNPGEQNPGEQNPGEQNPGEQNPGEQNPGEQNPGEQNPGEQNPGEQNPGEQNPGEQNPGEQNPGEQNPAQQKVAHVGEVVKDPSSGSQYRITQTSSTTKTVEWVIAGKNREEIEVPDVVVLDGIEYKVTSIADYAFWNDTKLETIIIGKNVKTIGKSAFEGCKKLKKVSMGNQVTTIKEQAFYKCIRLKDINMSAKLTSIGKKAFYKCTRLTTISIPSKVKKIGNQAFYGCKKLKNITIVTKKLTRKNVGKNVFKGISSKATIKVPKKKLSLYKKMLNEKAVGKNARIKSA